VRWLLGPPTRAGRLFDIARAARQALLSTSGALVSRFGALDQRMTELRTGVNLELAGTVDRAGLWEAQTPQVFSRRVIEQAFATAAGRAFTDEASLVEAAGHPVMVVPGSPINLKITSREDLRLAEQALKAMPKPKLSGPSHPFAGDDIWR
jgi:2-C-methyl-D-erythritol 4-phosphate cytidylyltransferase